MMAAPALSLGTEMEMMTGRMSAIPSHEKTIATKHMFLGLMWAVVFSVLGHLAYIVGTYLGGLLVL